MRVLFIALVWPEPGSSAAGIRTRQLIDAFLLDGHEVRVSSPCASNSHREEIERLGIETVCLPPNDIEFDRFIESYRPEVVIFDRFMVEEQFSWRVRQVCPDALRVLDTVDLHFLRRARKQVASGESVINFIPDEAVRSEDALREIASIYRSDLSLIISDAEQRLLREVFKIPESMLSVCRIGYELPSEVPHFSDRRDIAIIGNFNHEPNADSFQLLKRKLWKMIRDHIDHRISEKVELHIYGSYPKKEFIALDSPIDGFRVKGWTENSLETLKRYRLTLAPLRFGAGIKGKIADSWAAGTPVIGTTIAAEGMVGPQAEFPFGGAISDDWEKFAEICSEFYVNETRWREGQARGRAILDSLFSPQSNERHVVQTVAALRVIMDERRSANFVGSMLWYHQFRSTEFFSRWIEVKSELKRERYTSPAG